MWNCGIADTLLFSQYLPDGRQTTAAQSLRLYRDELVAEGRTNLPLVPSSTSLAGSVSGAAPAATTASPVCHGTERDRASDALKIREVRGASLLGCLSCVNTNCSVNDSAPLALVATPPSSEPPQSIRACALVLCACHLRHLRHLYPLFPLHFRIFARPLIFTRSPSTSFHSFVRSHPHSLDLACPSIPSLYPLQSRSPDRRSSLSRSPRTPPLGRGTSDVADDLLRNSGIEIGLGGEGSEEGQAYKNGCWGDNCARR